MSTNTENQESRPKEPQDLEHQQKDLFRELSQEQVEAEKALEEDQERSVTGKPQDESDA